MSTENTVPKRRRRNTKKLDAMKVGAAFVLLILGILFILWIGVQLSRPEDDPPELHPKPTKSMWDTPPSDG